MGTSIIRFSHMFACVGTVCYRIGSIYIQSVHYAALSDRSRCLYTSDVCSTAWLLILTAMSISCGIFMRKSTRATRWHWSMITIVTRHEIVWI